MDDVKSNINEDEFQFSDAEIEEGNPYDVATESTSGAKSKINRRTVLIGLGILIVGFSLYKLLSVFFGGDHHTDRPVTTSARPAAEPPAQSSNVAIQPQPGAHSDLPASMQRQLSQMQQHDRESRSQINDIADSLNNLSNTMNNLQSAVNSIGQQLQNITSDLQNQQAAIDALKPKESQVSSVPSSQKAAVVIPVWHVRAVIPGRAWLMQNNGQTISVKAGDALPGYGKILAISVVDGLVKTSSGVIIRFQGL